MLAELLAFIPFLILFEAILVYLDPQIETLITEFSGQAGGEPVYKLIVNAVLAGTIFPVHQFFERRLKGRVMKPKS